MISRLSVLGLAALTLVACGKQGDLERPAPLYGEARQRYLDETAAAQAERDKKAAAEAEETSGGEPTRRRVPDRAETLGTTRDAPLEGRRSNDPGAPGPR